jgi:hypothetical protein
VVLLGWQARVVDMDNMSNMRTSMAGDMDKIV